MNNFFLSVVVVTIFFLSNNSFAQDLIVLHDGSEATGYVTDHPFGRIIKIKSLSSNSRKKYKTKDVKEFVYDVKIFRRVEKMYSNSKLLGEIVKRDSIQALSFKKNRGLSYQHGPQRITGGKRFLCKILDGKLSLYVEFNRYNGQDLNSFSTVRYYIKRANSDVIEGVNFHYKRRFAKVVSEYLSDCTSLSERIKEKELLFEDLLEIINTYNKACE